MSTSNKFLAAFLSFALVIVGALVTIPSGALDWKAGIQLGIIGLSAGVTLLLPLVPSLKWQGILKTGIPVLLAVLNGVTPLILGGRYDHATIGLIVLNGLQVLASEIGVQVRTFPTPVTATVSA
jgi:hypothetical protein